MKRIINSVTYDTDTATEVFSAEDSHASDRWWGLYQTRHGAFFEVVNDCGEVEFYPSTDQKAQALLERRANHLVEQYFGPMPEYGSAEKRLTLRMPIGLYRRVESAAAVQKTDVNKFIQRCLEKATAPRGRGKAAA